jgi:hypothetical protein
MDKEKKHKNAEMGNNVFHRIVLNQIAGNIGFEEEEENVPCNTPRHSGRSRFGGLSAKFAASTSGSNGAESVSPGDYVRDPGSILSLQPWIFKRSSAQNNDEMVVPSGTRAVGRGKNLMDCFRDGSTVDVSARSPGLGPGSGRRRGALRSRRPQRHFINPLVTTDNSCIPQLYDENFEFEEYTFAPVPSPASARPFIVTDGRRIISKSRYDSVPVPFEIGLDKGCQNGSKLPESIVGVAPLPELNKSRRDRRVSQDASFSLPGSQRGTEPSNSATNISIMLQLLQYNLSRFHIFFYHLDTIH